MKPVDYGAFVQIPTVQTHEKGLLGYYHSRGKPVHQNHHYVHIRHCKEAWQKIRKNLQQLSHSQCSVVVLDAKTI